MSVITEDEITLMPNAKGAQGDTGPKGDKGDTGTNVSSVYRYYILRDASLPAPAIDDATVRPPTTGGVAWTLTEPAYSTGSTDKLYFTDCTVFSDNTLQYSSVCLSSSFEAARQAYNKADALDAEVDTVTDTVANHTTTLAQYSAAFEAAIYKNNLSAYMKFQMDTDGNPVLSLGGNQLQTKITNSAIEFWQGASKVAWISNQQLHIDQSVVLSQMDIGNEQWSWRLRTVGTGKNLFLKWIGN